MIRQVVKHSDADLKPAADALLAGGPEGFFHR